MFMAIKFGGLSGAAVAVLIVRFLLNIISYEITVGSFVILVLVLPWIFDNKFSLVVVDLLIFQR